MNGFGVSPLELMAADAMLQGIVFLDEFEYSAVWTGTTALAATSTVEVIILINGDSDFVVQERNIVAFDNQATPVLVPDPNLLITVTRAGAGRETMNQAQHVGNVLGSYQSNKVPGRRPMSGLWNAANTMSFKLQNLSPTNFGRIDITFSGFKVFYTVSRVPGHEGEQGTRAAVFHAL
jgi:hypothetical protein